MTQKIEKIKNEVIKTRQKITELQQRVEELDKQRIELENIEIIQLCRSADVPLTDIAGILRSCRDAAAVTPDPVAHPPASPAPAASAIYSGGASEGEEV